MRTDKMDGAEKNKGLIRVELVPGESCYVLLQLAGQPLLRLVNTIYSRLQGALEKSRNAQWN